MSCHMNSLPSSHFAVQSELCVHPPASLLVYASSSRGLEGPSMAMAAHLTSLVFGGPAWYPAEAESTYIPWDWLFSLRYRTPEF